MLQRFQYKNSWENKGNPHLSLISSIFFTSKSRYCNVPIALYIKMKVQNVKPLIYLDRNCNCALHQQHNEGCSKWMTQWSKLCSLHLLHCHDSILKRINMPTMCKAFSHDRESRREKRVTDLSAVAHPLLPGPRTCDALLEYKQMMSPA
jgi:hypothetical protein